MVPREVWTIDGTRPIAEFFAEEILAVTKSKPIRMVLSHYADPNISYSTWVVSLPNKVKPGFTLFNSALVHLSEQKVAIL